MSEIKTNQMTNYVLARFIEDVAVGDTEAVYGTLFEAQTELDSINSQNSVLKNQLKLFKVITEEV